VKKFEDHGALNHIFDSNVPSLVYSGALGEKQNAPGIVELFRIVLNKIPDAKAYIFSQGPIFDELKIEFESDRFFFLPLVDESNLAELLIKSTVQLIPQISGSSNGSLPSKLPNIIAASTPIFCITDKGSELVDIVGEYPCGEVSTSWDFEYNSGLICDMMRRYFIRRPDTSVELLNKFTREGLVSDILARSGL
jgi:colanic acid biosynthesis glycosyl transferase WcaI